MNLSAVSKRPLSMLVAMISSILILYEAIQIATGHLYKFGLVDATTIIELGIMALIGIYTLRDQTDLQAVSFTLAAGLSFIFMYEAIYKWSFYLAPFRLPMPPNEFREFIIYMGIAGTILTGFAVGYFRFKKWTFLFLVLFIVLWIFWLLIGFPQITGGCFTHPVIHLDLTSAMNYVLNRSTKLAMYLAYVTLFPIKNWRTLFPSPSYKQQKNRNL
jgi:hypothetical protein